MIALLQAAASPASFTMQHAYEALLGIALLLMGWHQTRAQKDRDDAHNEAQRDRDRITALEVHNAELRTHIGVDGNGILARLDRMEEKMEDRLDNVDQKVADILNHIMKRGA